jgi:hypothetical protein
MCASLHIVYICERQPTFSLVIIINSTAVCHPNAVLTGKPTPHDQKRAARAVTSTETVLLMLTEDDLISI